MKKVLWIAGGVIALPLLALLFAPILFYLIHTQPHSDEEITKLTLTYLEKKYDEQFVVQDINYSIPLGDDTGTYNITVANKQAESVIFSVRGSDSFSTPSDDYKEMRWRVEANEFVKPFLNALFQEDFTYMVNIGTTKEISDLPFETSYLTLLQDYQIEHYLYVYVKKRINSANVEDEYEREYKLYQYMNSLGLKDFLIDISYYNTELPVKDKTSEQRPHYIMMMDTRMKKDQEKINMIQQAADMKLFGRFLNNQTN